MQSCCREQVVSFFWPPGPNTCNAFSFLTLGGTEGTKLVASSISIVICMLVRSEAKVYSINVDQGET